MTASIAGQLVTEMFDYDSGRPVTVYIPPDPPRGVVFAGDGQLISQWGGVLGGGRRTADDDRRCTPAGRRDAAAPGVLTRSSNRSGSRLTSRFFVEDVRRWVQSRFGVALPAERTAVFGVSASGELALAMGLRHPDIYGAVFCASPGGWLPTACRDAESASARVPRRRHAGAVLPRERDPVGGPRCAAQARTSS